MKRIGILYDKSSKKVFLLPNEVKQLTQQGVMVNIPCGLGFCIGINDNEYIAAGAKVYPEWQAVINSSDVLLKVNAFNKTELALMKNKIAITMVNYLANVDMLYFMLENKVTGLEWCSLNDRNGFVLFPEIEETKAPLIMHYVKSAIAKGLATRAKDKVSYPKEPSMLILNATFAGVALAKQALASGFKVTLADNDTKYLVSLKKSSGLKDLDFVDANFETLVEQIKTKNVFVNTAINPTDLTKLRITKDMIQSMPKGSMAIDAACEYGYAFHFIKKYADKQLKWNKLDKSYYMAHEDITNLAGKEVSQIISSKSVKYLLDVIKQGTDNSVIWKITNCQGGKVVNSTINSKLHLY
ncbi:MAG: hypothetical protein ACOQNV_00365 [Mycoplasmoidaceae bacterium]